MFGLIILNHKPSIRSAYVAVRQVRERRNRKENSQKMLHRSLRAPSSRPNHSRSCDLSEARMPINASGCRGPSLKAPIASGGAVIVTDDAEIAIGGTVRHVYTAQMECGT